MGDALDVNRTRAIYIISVAKLHSWSGLCQEKREKSDVLKNGTFDEKTQ